MTDYASFTHGGATYPLSPDTTTSLLQDADPALWYALEFFATVIETHLGDRLRAEASLANIDAIENAVAMTVPINPEPYLTEGQYKFPLLAMWRTEASYLDAAVHFHEDSILRLVWIMPPMTAGEAERLQPALRAVQAIVKARGEQGADPTFAPAGQAAGSSVWAAANIEKFNVTKATFGDYEAASGDLYFPTVVLDIAIRERVSNTVASDFQVMTSARVQEDLVDPAGVDDRLDDVVTTDITTD